MPRGRAGLAPADQASPHRGPHRASPPAPPLVTAKVVRIVLAIVAVGCASIALVLVLARRSAVAAASMQAATLAELIAAQADLDLRTDRGDRPAALKTLWSRLQRHLPEGSLSTVSVDGKVALHTSR